MLRSKHITFLLNQCKNNQRFKYYQNQQVISILEYYENNSKVLKKIEVNEFLNKFENKEVSAYFVILLENNFPDLRTPEFKENLDNQIKEEINKFKKEEGYFLNKEDIRMGKHPIHPIGTAEINGEQYLLFATETHGLRNKPEWFIEVYKYIPLPIKDSKQPKSLLNNDIIEVIKTQDFELYEKLINHMQENNLKNEDIFITESHRWIRRDLVTSETHLYKGEITHSYYSSLFLIWKWGNLTRERFNYKIKEKYLFNELTEKYEINEKFAISKTEIECFNMETQKYETIKGTQVKELTPQQFEVVKQAAEACLGLDSTARKLEWREPRKFVVNLEDSEL